jgi:autotransporter-associated beta strand protein
MEGAGGLYLGSANSYTGPTTVSAGFMYLGAQGALPASTALTMAGGTVEFAYPGRAAFSQTVASLSGSFGLVTNSDFGNPATFTVNQATDSAYEGSISGNLGLIKDGPGKLAIAGINSYSEATLVNGGTLEVNGVIDGSTLTVSAGAVLAGGGTISSPVLVQGTLAPGVNGPGTLTLTGDNLVLGSNSQTLLEIANANALVGFDRVIGIGMLTLDGTLKLSLLSGYTPEPGATFNLFGASSFSSQSFDVSTDLLLPALDSTLAWKTDEFTTTGTLYIVPVPEVTSLHAIVSAAAVAVAAHRRRPRGMSDRSG